MDRRWRRPRRDIHGNVAALDAALADIKRHKRRPHRHPGRPRRSTARARPRRVDARHGARRRRGDRHRGQHRHRGRGRRLRGRLPVARRGPERATGGGRVGARPARRRAARLPAPPARRAAALVGRRRSCSPVTPRPAARRRACPADLDAVADRPARHPDRRPRHRAAATPTSPTCASWAASSSSTRAPAAMPSMAAGCVLGAPRAAGRRRAPARSCAGRRTTPRRLPSEVSARGLPGDVYRAATIRTGRFVR